MGQPTHTADPANHTPSDVQDIHLVFKTHLDVGFTDLARNVVADYFSYFIPKAIRNAEILRQADRPERLIWTTGSWLIYEYLEHAPPAARRRLEAAILAGDIAWHALPYTVHSELMDPSIFAHGLELSQELDRRFGRQTITAKMTDVPGHTRGIVPLLAAAGVRFLHLGVNSASTMPSVPPVFVWQDPTGAEIVVMYDQHYGGFAHVPGSTAALAIEHTNDNQGPPTIDAVLDAFDHHRASTPTARITASTLDAYARTVLPLQHTLPIVTAEIGDTWIHGIASDPTKVARFRELTRLRRHWLATGRLTPTDSAYSPFSRSLLLVPEHTWGLDTKKHLGDWTTYDLPTFTAALDRPHFRHFASSWTEQRAYLDTALEALTGSPLAAEAAEHLAQLQPHEPNPSDWTPVPTNTFAFETSHFRLCLDPNHGALIGLEHKVTNRAWASPDHPLALLRYDTYGAADYDRFMDQYVLPSMRHEPWVVRDQGKPGLEHTSATRQTRLPTLTTIARSQDDATHRFLLNLTMPEESPGAPRRLTIELAFPAAAPELRVTVQWFDKPACRLPEALWLSFNPPVTPDGAWSLHKLGQWLPSTDVVPNGNRRLHAVESGVAYEDATNRLLIETLDAPLVAIGTPTLLDFTNDLPHPHEGIHVNLFNNIWGTNFPQWFGEDARFRFTLRLDPRPLP
jgi:hypothetical protein